MTRIEIKEIWVLHNYPREGIEINTKTLEQAEQLKSQILSDYRFAERCTKDGILTYSRDCEENKVIVNRLKERIKNRKECWSKECMGCEEDYLINEFQKILGEKE